jgi:hypothetical protein
MLAFEVKIPIIVLKQRQFKMGNIMKTICVCLILSIFVFTQAQLFAAFSYVNNNPVTTVVPYGGTFTYSVSWSGGSENYEGATNLAYLSDLSTPHSTLNIGTYYPGAYTYSYTISGAVSTDEGAYYLQIYPGYNLASIYTTSVDLYLSPAILSQPTNTVCISGSSTTMGIAAGPNTATFQWFNAANQSSITSSSTSPILTPTIANSGELVYCKIINSYGSVSSSNALLTVGVTPSIDSQPTNVAAAFGGSATFSVVLSGTPTQPVYYQWYKNGTVMTNANLSSITISPIGVSDLGMYRVLITNFFGSITSSSAALSGNAPTIAVQPTNIYTIIGSNALFSVVANGTQPLYYQWYANGNAIQGANLSYFILPSVTNSENGTFAVAVSNLLGWIASSNATLNVGIPASITIQPKDIAVVQGQDDAFTVGVSGTPPFFFTWKGTLSAYNDHTYVVGTSSNYDIYSWAGPYNYNVSGNYAVVISNFYGCVTSSVATLLLGVPPQILNIFDCTNNNVMLTMNGTAGFCYLLQESTDLSSISNWQSIRSIMTDSNGVWTFTDTNGFINPAVFYRVTIP